MSFIQFLLILRARLLVVLAIAGVVISATLVVSLLLPKQYSATATVLIDAKGVDPITGLATSMMMQSAYMATQVDIASSDRVAMRVNKVLKLDDIPQFRDRWLKDTEGKGSFDLWLAGLIGKKVSIKPARESNVLNIDFQWPDAKAAATFANAFAQAYIDTTLELKVEPARQYASFFADRAKTLRTDLETYQKKLSDYQRENGITAADERLDVETARLNELSSQLVGIQSQRIETASRQREAGNKETMTEVLQNTLISQLKADLARAESKREDVVTRLGKNHPEYQRTESEIASLREKIDRETARVISSLSTNMQANLQRESELKAAVDAQKRKLLELKNQRDQLTVLQNDVTNAQHAYDAINQRMTQTNLESQSQQANIVLMTPAYEPSAYSSPKIMLNMFLAVVFGFFLGAGAAMMLELFNPCVRGAQDLQALLKLPVLGSLQRKSDFRLGRSKYLSFRRRTEPA